MKLKIGCKEREEGFTHIDIDPQTNPDYVLHAENMHLIAANSVEYAKLDNVLEHCDMFKAMKEVHRVCKDRAIIEIWMPHFSSAHTWMHLQHKRGGSYFMFDTQRCEEYGFMFTILDRRILIEGRHYPYQKTNWTRWHFPFLLIEKLTNKFPYTFERLWCYWVGGAESLYFKLEVRK